MLNMDTKRQLYARPTKTVGTNGSRRSGRDSAGVDSDRIDFGAGEADSGVPEPSSRTLAGTSHSTGDAEKKWKWFLIPAKPGPPRGIKAKVGSRLSCCASN